jgi:hypothetical protein
MWYKKAKKGGGEKRNEKAKKGGKEKKKCALLLSRLQERYCKRDEFYCFTTTFLLDCCCRGCSS